MTKTWKSSHFWPLDLDLTQGLAPLVPKLESKVQKQTSADTPLLIRKLADNIEQAIFGKGKGKGSANAKANDPVARGLFHSVIYGACVSTST